MLCEDVTWHQLNANASMLPAHNDDAMFSGNICRGHHDCLACYHTNIWQLAQKYSRWNWNFCVSRWDLVLTHVQKFVCIEIFNKTEFYLFHEMCDL